jgi:hypothetical protein
MGGHDFGSELHRLVLPGAAGIGASGMERRVKASALAWRLVPVRE